MAVFQRFFQVACSLAALLAALLLVVPSGGHDRPAIWPVYLAGSIVLGFDAIRPTLLKGRIVWIAMATVTLAGTGFGLLVRRAEDCCVFGLGYPYSWILTRGDTISLNLYQLGFSLLFWICAAAASTGLILGIRYLRGQSQARANPAVNAPTFK